MVRIVDQARVAIHEDALRLREGHAVLGKVAARLFRIPGKESFAHSNSLAIMRLSFVLDFIGSHGEWCGILTRLTIRAKPLATVALLAPPLRANIAETLSPAGPLHIIGNERGNCFLQRTEGRQ